MTSGLWRRALLTVHIATSVGLVGAAAVLAVLGLSGVGGADPRTVYPAAHLVEARVIAPLAVLALATGLLQARLSRWSLLRNRWVTVKLVVTAGLTAVVFTVLEPALAAVADAAVAGEPLAGAQRLRLLIFPLVAAALLLLNVALGVYKPDRRRVAGRPADADRSDRPDVRRVATTRGSSNTPVRHDGT
jgi:hypothetical protein